MTQCRCGAKVFAPRTLLGAPVKLEPEMKPGGRWRLRGGTARFIGVGPGMGYELHKCKTSNVAQMFE